MAWISKDSIFGKIIRYTPLAFFPGIAGQVKGSWFDNLSKKLFGNGLTESDKEKIELEDKYADDNAYRDLDIARIKWSEMDSPAAQIQAQAEGYKAVGLNLMGLAGNGAVSGASAQTSGPTPGDAESSNGSPATLLSFLSAMIGKKAEIANLQAEAGVRKETALGLSIDNEFKRERNQLELERLRGEIHLQAANLGKINADTELAKLAAFYYPELKDSEIARNYSDVQRNMAEADKFYSDIEVNDARVQEIYSTISKNKAEENQLNALAEKLREEAALLVEEKNLTHERIQEVKDNCTKLQEEAKLIGRKIQLSDKDIEFYLMNHIRILDSNTDDGTLTVTYFDPSTGKVVKKGKIARTYRVDVNPSNPSNK